MSMSFRQRLAARGYAWFVSMKVVKSACAIPVFAVCCVLWLCAALVYFIKQSASCVVNTAAEAFGEGVDFWRRGYWFSGYSRAHYKRLGYVRNGGEK